jgi:ATP-dependent Lon protease
MTRKKLINSSTQTEYLPPPPPLPPSIQNFYIISNDPKAEEEEEHEDYEDPNDPDYCSEENEKDNLKRAYSRDDSAFYEQLTKKKKKKIDKTEELLNGINFFKTPMRFHVLESKMDDKLKSLAIQKIDELNSMFVGSGEYFKLKNWIEALCKLPIGKYKSLPVCKTDPIDKISTFMQNTRKKFDELVYGHDHAKNQIIHLLAKNISNPTSNGIVIGIQGVPGVGKTTLALALCESLDIPYGFISLAGINGEPFFTGFSSTYEGARNGRIADLLISSQCMNPILYFDELDKISKSSHGEEVANFLIHLTDFSQNSKFQDKYFGDIDLDMSKSIFIFSYNNIENINPILKDRMITIQTDGYKINEKLKLAADYILPKILKEFGFQKEDVIFTDETIKYIINKVDDEEGARCMQRGFSELIGSLNYKKILGELNEFPLTITAKLIDEYIIINKKKENSFSANMMYA